MGDGDFKRQINALRKGMDKFKEGRERREQKLAARREEEVEEDFTVWVPPDERGEDYIPPIPLKLEEPAPRRKVAEPSKPANSTTVRTWFVDAIHEHLSPTIHVASWGVAENSMGKRLLTEYGAEMTKRAVGLLCSRWKGLVTAGKFQGLPTIRVLVSMRDQIFGQLQLEDAGLVGRVATPEKKIRRDEYDETSAASGPSVGWGDE